MKETVRCSVCNKTVIYTSKSEKRYYLKGRIVAAKVTPETLCRDCLG